MKKTLKSLSTAITDSYDRPITYLRISVTDRCNLRCVYCMPPHGLITKLRHREILTYEEILRIVRIGTGLGIKKVRITGGEPLVRKDICGFLRELTSIEELKDISITTNGVLLKDNLEAIRSAGITRINISLDTLQRDKYLRITGRDYFEQVWEAIMLAHQIGMHPVKINVVALRGINDDEILDFARLTFSYPFQIRFIEHMDVGDTCIKISNNIRAPDIKNRIGLTGKLRPLPKGSYDGPATLFEIPGSVGQIGFITAISDHFCRTCNRMRLTASGKLRACLLSDNEEDIKGPMRSGCSDDELVDILKHAVGRKPPGHRITEGHPVRVGSRMSAIGG